MTCLLDMSARVTGLALPKAGFVGAEVEASWIISLTPVAKETLLVLFFAAAVVGIGGGFSPPSAEERVGSDPSG